MADMAKIWNNELTINLLNFFRRFFGKIEDTINCYWDLLTFSKHGISLGHVTASAVLSNFLPKRLSVCLLAYLCYVCLSTQALVAQGSLKARTIISSSTRVVGVKKNRRNFRLLQTSSFRLATFINVNKSRKDLRR